MTGPKPVRIGKYLLLDRVAIGGMAELYKAKIMGAEGFEKLVAVKKILTHLTGEKDLVKAFIDEAKLAAFLQHQNIVQIYDFGSMDGDYFIAMEYLSGQNLQAILNKAQQKKLPLSLENAIYITSRICDGLDYSHNLKDFQGRRLNIIHRDISPANILITYEGQVKIVDFGIAKASSKSTVTQVNVIKGKVAFMSPEQAEGKAIDHRSDIFSTGILLYEMVTGKRMYGGETMEVLSKARKGEYDAPEGLVDDFPPLLSRIIHKALAKKPGQRYQSGGKMLTDLEQCLYQLSFRPIARGLARYMMKLFREEAVAEELAVQKAAQIDLKGGLGDDGQRAATDGSYEKTIPIDTDDVRQERKGKGLGLYVEGRFGENSVAKESAVQAATQADAKAGFEAAEGVRGIKRSYWKAIAAPIKQVVFGKKRKWQWYAVAAVLLAAVGIFVVNFVQQNKISSGFEAGIEAFEAKRFAEAISLFEKIAADDPSMLERITDPYCQALQGLAFEVAKTDTEGAKVLLRKSLELDGENVQGHFQMALVYVREKDYPRAIATYQKVAELDPMFADAFFNLGYVYAIIKDYSSSEEMYRHSAKLAPPFLDEALFNLAMIQEKLGKMDRCIKNLEEAVKVNPENELAKTNLQRLKGSGS